jgi:hypothetical protein
VVSDPFLPLTRVAPVAVAVSISVNFKSGAAESAIVLGALFFEAWIVKESVEDKAKPVTETVPAVLVSEAAPPKDPVPLTTVTVNWLPAAPENAACEGAELSKPIPNAATATSAMRLKFVVVDMYFLSIVVTRNFLVAASR